MTLTDDSHTLNPAPPRPPTRKTSGYTYRPPRPPTGMGAGSTSRLPTSQAPTDKPDPLNPGSSSLHDDTDSNPSPYQGQDRQMTLTGDSHALNPASPDSSLRLGLGSTYPPTQGPTLADNHPPPASLSNQGPSTEPILQPVAKRPRPDDPEWLGALSKMFKGKIKRRFSPVH